MTTFYKGKAIRILVYIGLIAFALISLYPLIWMSLNSLKNNDEIFATNIFGFPTQLRFENYVHAVTQFNIPLFFMNSLIVAVSTVVITILIALPFSYATARMKWRFSSAFRVYGTIGMFIPVQIIIIPLVIIVRELHIQNSLLSVIVPYVAFNLSFTSLLFYSYFRTIPMELEESASIDGANIYQTVALIIVPLVKPAVASSATFIFLNSWNELFTALVVIADNSLKTLPLGLAYFQGQFSTDWGASSAAMTIACALPIVIYLALSEQVEKALTVESAVKG